MDDLRVDMDFIERGDDPGRPYRELWSAVIVQALKDMREGGEEGLEAELFFFSPGYEQDRVRVAGLAGIDPEVLPDVAHRAKALFEQEDEEITEAAGLTPKERRAREQKEGRAFGRRVPIRFTGGV